MTGFVGLAILLTRVRKEKKVTQYELNFKPSVKSSLQNLTVGMCNTNLEISKPLFPPVKCLDLSLQSNFDIAKLTL